MLTFSSRHSTSMANDDDDDDDDDDDEGDNDDDGDLPQLAGVHLDTGCAGLSLQIQLRLRDITFLVLV